MSVCPARAEAMLPRNGWPISAGSGWVYRIPSGLMIVMKSTPASARIRSANGCS